MRPHDGAKDFEIDNLANKFDKDSVGLYRDNGLSLFKNINSQINHVKNSTYLLRKTDYL